jgi:hypothetical protein
VNCPISNSKLGPNAASRQKRPIPSRTHAGRQPFKSGEIVRGSGDGPPRPHSFPPRLFTPVPPGASQWLDMRIMELLQHAPNAPWWAVCHTTCRAAACFKQTDHPQPVG